MMNINKEHVLRLILEQEVLIDTAEISAPHDYQSLKALVVYKEIVEELAFLKEALMRDNFQVLFKERCRLRALRNAGTCLSFTEMPKGATNSLYWDIAMLFQPKTFGEVFGLLQPQVTEYIVFEEILKKANPVRSLTSKDICFELRVQDVEAWIEAASLERFSDFVINEQRVLDARDIAKFNFDLHQTFFQALSKTYPEVAFSLYRHNYALRQLFSHLLFFQGKGQTPYEAIKTLIQELRLGGKRMTGAEYASSTTHSAVVSFNEYVNELPSAVKEQLLSLTTSNSKNLKSILEDLTKGVCVEMIASCLQSLLENRSAHKFLITHPTLSEEYQGIIAKGYHYKKLLHTKADNSNTRLPMKFLKAVLSKIVINQPYDYVSLLLSFPTELYAPLLQYAHITDSADLFKELGARIKEGILNDEQKHAFYEALFANIKKFDLFSLTFLYLSSGASKDEIVAFYQKHLMPAGFNLARERNEKGTLLHLLVVQPEALRTILLLLPEEERLDVIKKKSIYDSNTVLHSAANNPESLQAILSSLPERERLNVIKEKGQNGDSVLHSAVNNPESLQAILSSFPEGERLNAVNEKDRNANTVLHSAINNPESLQAILSSIPKEERLNAIKEKGQYGYIALHSATNNPKSLQAILFSFSEGERMNVIKIKSQNGNTVLYFALNNPDSLEAILFSLPKVERLNAVNEEDNNGSTILHSAINNPKALEAILFSLPEKDRLNAVNKRDPNGNTVLHSAINNPESLKIILFFLPKEGRLSAIKEKSQNGNIAIYSAVNNPKSLQAIFSSLPKDERLTVIKEKNQNGYTILHYAVNNPESLKAILFSAPEEERLSLIKEKTQNVNTVLHYAVNNPESLKAILSSILEKWRLNAINEKDQNGNTVLYSAVKNPQSLQAILLLLPEGEHLNALKEKNSKGKSLLHEATDNPRLLHDILNTFSPLERLHCVITMAQIKYKQWYGYAEQGSLFRWIRHNVSDYGVSGFFSRKRTYEQNHVKKLNQEILSAQNIDAAILGINAFLSDGETYYGQYSFTSFFLDGLKEIQNSPWSGLSRESSSNCYQQKEVILHLNSMSMNKQ